MDKIAGLISNIELFIRYLLSGVAIYAIYLLGLCDSSAHITWISKQPLLAAFIASTIGFTLYSIYRLVFWIIGDGIAWFLGLSAPSIDRIKGESNYAPSYAKFLIWRRKDFNETLNGYLHYRWAVVHFVNIVAAALIFALVNKEVGSIIAIWHCYTVAAASLCLLAAMWQSCFLFRLERELYNLDRIKLHKTTTK